MKYLSSFLLRAVCAIVIGILLIKNPGGLPTGITMLAGFLFLITGVISCASYFGLLKFGNTETIDGKKQKPTFPIVGIGSIICGIIMVFSPDMVVKLLMYIFGAILVLGAVNELYVLFKLFKKVKIGAFFWILPSLILVTGLFVLIKPMESVELPFIICGWCLVLYGMSEIINSIKVYTINKNLKKLYLEEMARNEKKDDDYEEAEEAK